MKKKKEKTLGKKKKKQFSQCAGQLLVIKDLKVQYRKVRSYPRQGWCTAASLAYLYQVPFGKLLGN